MKYRPYASLRHQAGPQVAILLVRHHAQWSGQIVQRQSVKSKTGKGCRISGAPGRGEKTALAGITIRQRQSASIPIGNAVRAIGIAAQRNRCRSDAISQPRPKRGECLSHGGQRSQRLHRRIVIGRVNDWRGRVRDVIDIGAGRTFAVEFGEVRHHATADFGHRKRGPGGGVIVLKGRQIGPGVARLIALEQRTGANQHGFRRDAGATQDRSRRLQFARWFAGRRNDQLKLDGGIATRREARDFGCPGLELRRVQPPNQHQCLRRQRFERLHGSGVAFSLLDVEACPDRRHRARVAVAKTQSRIDRRFDRWRRNLRQLDFDLLPKPKIGGKQIWPWVEQRPDIGFEGRVRPVALIFHFARRALMRWQRCIDAAMHARPAAWRVVERADIEGGLPRADRPRKLRQLPASVGVSNFKVEAGEVSWMQDHQPATICRQWTAGLPF